MDRVETPGSTNRNHKYLVELAEPATTDPIPKRAPLHILGEYNDLFVDRGKEAACGHVGMRRQAEPRLDLLEQIAALTRS